MKPVSQAFACICTFLRFLFICVLHVLQAEISGPECMCKCVSLRCSFGHDVFVHLVRGAHQVLVVWGACSTGGG
jgi:hypothetical protein